MFSLFRFIIIASFLLGINQSFASDSNVECVKQQLIASGIEVKVNGSDWDDELPNAIELLKTIHKDLNGLRAINADNAVMWCHEIGLVDESLQKYWPAKVHGEFKIYAGKNASKNDLKSLRIAMETASDFFSNYGFSLVDSVKLVYADDQAEITRIVTDLNKSEFPYSDVQKIIHEQCTNQLMSGLNLRGIIVICTRPDQDLASIQKELDILMVHELAHEINRQLAGYVPTNILDLRERIALSGPRWLAEATATVFEQKFANPQLTPIYFESFFKARAPLFSGYKLASMIDNRSTFEFDFASYVIRASQLLIKDDDERLIFKFWRALARQNWDVAFLSAFGQSTDEFYRNFSYLNPLYQPVPKGPKNTDLGVACVQHQLSMLGINVGPVDGILGRKTRNGLSQLTKNHPQLRELRRLTKDSAIAWCHEIAIIDPILWRSTPSFTGGEFNFIFADDITDQEKLLIVDMTYFAHRRLRLAGIFVPGRVDIIYGRDVEKLASEVKKIGRDPNSRISQLKEIDRLCNTDDRPSAIFGSDGHFVICLGEEELSLENKAALSQTIAESVAHQLLHETQFQLGGYLPKNPSAVEYVKRRGPVWAVEGTTIAILHSLFNPNMSPQEFIDARTYSVKIEDPSAIVPYEIVPLDEHFEFGIPAFHQLAERHGGYSNHLRLWRMLARNDWETAFQKTYGLEIDQFYREYRPPMLTAKTKVENSENE